MFVTSGSSMAPLIETGSELIVDWHPKTFKLGDIILFFNQYHRFVAHRIIAIDSAQRNKRYLIKGDNTSHDDGWIKEGQLVGKVLTIVRGGNSVEVDGPKRTHDKPVLRWAYRLWNVLISPCYWRKKPDHSLLRKKRLSSV